MARIIDVAKAQEAFDRAAHEALHGPRDVRAGRFVAGDASVNPPIVCFPFSRGVWYTFSDFLKFEQHLLSPRWADRKLDADLRLNRKRWWIKIRNEEVYPAWHYSKHFKIAAFAEYCIGLAGAVADVEVRADGAKHKLQVTTAGPLWGNKTQWGKDHMLHMEQLNQEGQSSGWGPYRKQSDGSISNRDEAIGSDERDPAYFAGIRQALEGKKLNQHSDCELIVYAGSYDEVMDRSSFSRIANAALDEVPLSIFAAVHVLAAREGFIVSRQRNGADRK